MPLLLFLRNNKKAIVANCCYAISPEGRKAHRRPRAAPLPSEVLTHRRPEGCPRGTGERSVFPKETLEPIGPVGLTNPD